MLIVRVAAIILAMILSSCGGKSGTQGFRRHEAVASGFLAAMRRFGDVAVDGRAKDQIAGMNALTRRFVEMARELDALGPFPESVRNGVDRKMIEFNSDLNARCARKWSGSAVGVDAFGVGVDMEAWMRSYDACLAAMENAMSKADLNPDYN